MVVKISIYSYKSNYEKEITDELEFNEEINTIVKLLSFINYDIEHVALKRNGIPENVSIESRTREIKNNFTINDDDTIELFVIPSSPEFYLPTLEFFSDCEEHNLEEMKNHNCNYFNFPNVVIEEKTFADVFVHHSRTDMAKQDLLYGDLIKSVGRGKFKITNKGLRFRKF